MKKWLWAWGAFWVTLCVWAQPIDSVLAVVNGEVITRMQLEKRLRPLEQQAASEHMSLDANLREQVLERMILETIERQQASRAGLRVDDATLDHALATLAEENHLSVEDFQRMAEADGLDFSAFRENLRDELLMNTFQHRELDRRVQVSERDVDAYMNSPAYQAQAGTRYHVAHIVIGAGSDSSSQEASRRLAQSLLMQLEEGAEFSALATKHSIAHNASEGGDLGWRLLTEIPDIYRSKVLTLQPGDSVGPLHSKRGYHLLHLIDKESLEGSNATSAEREKIRALLYQRRYQEALAQWLPSLRAQAHVEMMTDSV